MLNKIKLYIVDIEETTINRLEELFYNNPQLGIKVIGYSHNFNSCVNDLGRAKEADVFLVSAYLPDTMGIDLIEKIKRANPNSKIIIMLEKNTRNLAEVSTDKGAHDIIQKPFKAKQLIEKIQELIEKPSLDDVEFGSANASSNSYTDSHFQTGNDDEDDAGGRKRFKISDSNLANNEYDDRSNKQLSTTDNTNKNDRRALFDMYSNTPSNSLYSLNENEFEGDKPKVVAVFSSTSSSGKTTMLVNVAAAIAEHSEYKPRICILDFNLLFPSVLYKFHQDDLILCRKNIYDLCEDINHLDEELIKQATVTHEPTGIKIVDTPSDVIRDLSRVNASTIEQIITNLKEYYDLILIDTSSNIRDDSTSFPLTIADKAFIFLEPDLASLLHTRKLITMLRVFENNLPEKITEKMTFILNKHNPKTGIHVDTIKKTLFNNEVKIQIPDDTEVTHRSNNGQFVYNLNNATGRSILDLARAVYPLEKELFLNKPNKSNNGGIFGSLFGGKKKN